MTDECSPPREDWIAMQRTAHPSTTALVDGGDEWELTYRTLDEHVETTAGRLAGIGVEAGAHLGLLLHRSVSLAVLVFAAQRLGAVVVPFDPDLPKATLRARIDRFDVDWLVHQDGHQVNDLECEVTPLMTDNGPIPFETEPVETVTAHGWSAADPMVLLATSGTTGRAKGVILTAGNLWAAAVASAFRLGVDREDRWYCCLPIHHMGGLAPIYRSAAYGTTIVIDPARSFDPHRTLPQLRSTDATGVSLVPRMLDRLLDHDEGTLAGLRFALIGGGPIRPALLERGRDRGVPVCPTYGMTETTAQVATGCPTMVDTDPTAIGRPLPFVDMSIVDDAGDPVEPGQTGEIVVGGPTVMAGYYGDPDGTEAAMGPRGFRTGDVGSLTPDGRLMVHGRLDDRIISGGETIDPTTVAESIRSVEGVEDVAVLGLADPEWGEIVTAAVTLDPDAAVSNEEVLAQCRRDLPPYAVPKRVHVFESLPRTASGTIDRQRLREQLRR